MAKLTSERLVQAQFGKSCVPMKGRHDGFSSSVTVFHPSLILLAWGVVAIATASKFWRLTRGSNTTTTEPQDVTEDARQRLERVWRQSP